MHESHRFQTKTRHLVKKVARSDEARRLAWEAKQSSKTAPVAKNGETTAKHGEATATGINTDSGVDNDVGTTSTKC